MEANSCFMEKKRLRGKDILRIDGLLPPTRRLPVCNAVTSMSDKKKEKKWSIGGILKRISSMKDDDSSSNEEEIVYCKRNARNPPKANKQSDNIVLHPVRNVSERPTESINSVPENNTERSMESLNVQRDSLQSRSSDGSLDGLVRKIRKSKMKARVEAKRDRLCPNSSSDEDSRISNNSLAKPQLDDHAQNVCKTNSYNRRTRGARTERYIKRLFKEEVCAEDGNQINCKRNSTEYLEEGQRVIVNDASRLVTYPRRSATQSNDYSIAPYKTVPSQDTSTIARCTENRSLSNYTEYSVNKHFTDMNQNNFYERIDDPFAFPRSIEKDHALEQRTMPRSPNPPDPPPRDPRRVPTYTCHSFPFNGRSQKKRHLDGYLNNITDQRLDWTRAYSSSEEIKIGDSQTVAVLERNKTNTRPRDYANNKYTSMCSNRSNDLEYRSSSQLDEPEALKCRRKNNRNNQLSSNVNERVEGSKQIELTTCENGIYGRISARNTRSLPQNERNPGDEVEAKNSNKKEEDNETLRMNEEASERKRSSKNLEEAISELEAIYNSLKLSDEDLLDRAERRSMEEFSLRRGQVEDEPMRPNRPDSPDRLKDDMAYRRMHPVERPTSLSDIIGQSSLSSISYLIASPVLSRKDTLLDKVTTPTARPNEPDVTRDDVVFRSIHRANNTLKVIEPQPPFGIPLGPVTTATESDYLHTVPSKSNTPRSPYIPQCEPDIVTDDLAFRTLRKGATNTKTSADNRTESTVNNGEFPAKKKRAVRSLSANLYGLINQERIHLHRQPSLREINDENLDGDRKFADKPDHFRRVVSDGELSDQGSVRWRTERYTKKTFDINGNHPDSGLCRKMLRVYVSPSTTMQWSVKDSNREETPTSTFVSATRRTSADAGQQELQKREESLKDNTDSDFTAYTRLCQDLVDIIKGTDNVNAANTEVNSTRETKVEIEPLITELRKELLEETRVDRPNEFSKREIEIEDVECVDLKLDEDCGNTVETEDDKLDYYLRLANENVKMIAEAFSSVADHLRDGLDDSSTRVRSDSEISESSVRSSSCLNEETEIVSSKDEKDNSTKAVIIAESKRLDVPNSNCVKRRSDIEVDLNKAVEDLQMAAASLNENVQEEVPVNVEKEKNYDNELFIVEKSDVGPAEENVLRERKRKSVEAQDDGEERAVGEGERNVCEVDCKTCYERDQQLAREMELRVPYVTNIITITITEYSMVLLACLLALLLAIVAAS